METNNNTIKQPSPRPNGDPGEGRLEDMAVIGQAEVATAVNKETIQSQEKGLIEGGQLQRRNVTIPLVHRNSGSIVKDNDDISPQDQKRNDGQGSSNQSTQKVDEEAQILELRGKGSQTVKAVQADGVKSSSRKGSVRNGSAARMGQRPIQFNADDSTQLPQSYLDDVLALALPPNTQNQPITRLSIAEQTANARAAAGSINIPGGSGPFQPNRSFGNRHQSVDVRGHQRGIQPSGARNQGFPGQSRNPSQISTLSLNPHKEMYEEIRQNNLVKISKLMEPFMVNKRTSESHTGRDTQQKNRSIKNTFQPLHQQNKSLLDRRPTHATDAEASDYHGGIGPKMHINLPKTLVMHQLSKQLDASLFENSVSGPTGLRSREDQEASSFLEHVQGRAGERGKATERPGGSQAMGPRLIGSGAQVTANARSIRTNEPQPQTGSIFDMTSPHSAMGHAQESQLEALRLQPQLSSRNSLGGPGGAGPVGGLTSFHVTDLLERSVMGGSKPGAERSQLRHMVELYKRQVKPNKEVGARSRLMIRNYRLHVVKDAAKELTPEILRLATINKGTTIPTFNSVIRPEIYKFGTAVTSQIEHAWPEIMAGAAPPRKQAASLAKPSNFQLRSHSLQPAADGVLVPQYAGGLGPEWPDDIASEAEMQEQRDLEVQDMMDEAHQREARSGRSAASHGSRASARRDAEEQAELLSEQVAGLGDGLSSRPYTATEQAELEALAAVNKVFDRWLRNITTAKSEPESPAQRRVLHNGRPAPPSVKEINWHIQVARTAHLKTKPLPLDMLSTTSRHAAAPYRELQMLVINQDIREWYSRWVLQTQTVQSYSQIVQHDLQAMRYGESKVAIDFSRHHLTHLDPSVLRDQHVPVELFIDYDRWIKPLARETWALREQNELRKPHEWVGLPAFTHWSYGRTNAEIEVRIVDYDPAAARFLVRNEELRVEAWRSRLYLRRPGESGPELEATRVSCLRLRTESLHFLRVQRLITKELTMRYSYLRQSNEVLKRIQLKLDVNLGQFNPDSVRKIIVQIEALYVFSVLKATLSSQSTDPFIKGLLLKYRVPPASPALHGFVQLPKLKRELQGMKDVNIKAVKVELDHNSLLLMDAKYIKLPQFLNSLTLRTIGAHKLFTFPYDVSLLKAQGSSELRKLSPADVHTAVNTFPLIHSKFVHAQKLMASYFHSVAKYRWAEAIQREMWSFVKDDFDFDTGKELTMEQIDPALRRLFYQLRAYMQAVIVEHFELALRDYMRFLLSFILRDADMRATKIVKEVQFDPCIRLSLVEHGIVQLLPGEIVNDTELIPLSRTAMIRVTALVEDQHVPGKVHRRQKVVTKPELDAVSQDLFSVVLAMHEALHEIDRVDGLVFPLLQLDDPFLVVPDAKSDKKLQRYIRALELLIEQSLKATRKEVSVVNAFVPIFEKRIENLILDLKKRSFALQQNLSDGAGAEDEEKEKEGESAKDPGTSQPGSREKSERDARESVGEQNESSGEEDETDGVGGGGYQGNDLAYKSVEIDEGLLSEELAYLRGLVWKILETVHDHYDFGLVHLDATRFKERIVAHVRGLVEHIEHHLQAEFMAAQRNVQAEIAGVEGQLGHEAESIDEVIILLDYIESLKRQDNKVADIAQLIESLASRMTFIESVAIMFEAAQYQGYLAMRNWPRTFLQYIEERKAALLDQKEDLYTLMRREIEDVFAKIKEFREAIAEAVGQGLVEKALSYDGEDDGLGSLGGGSDAGSAPGHAGDGENTAEDAAGDEDEAQKLEAQRQAESAEGKTFPWLARLINMEHMKFDPQLVEKVFLKVDTLKQTYDEVERATALINKRETLLGVAKTQFVELRQVQDDLKPLHELWRVAYRFGRTMPPWVEGRFDQLDAAAIEVRVEEWTNELKRLQKTALVTEHPKQQELQKFVADAVSQFKRYGPMLRTLRTQGLAPRHWRMIGEKLGVQIDPARITLYRLVQLELYDEEKLKTTKAICEIASKEHALQVALESLDAEMMAVEFEFQLQADGETVALTRLPEVIAVFAEFALRVGALKTNPHIRNFLEKLLELEKTIKGVGELLSEWASFQRNYLYLSGIFVLEEITRALPREAKAFLHVAALYTASTQAFRAAPQVYRISLREHYLTVLVRNNVECDSIRAGLVGLLEKKRGHFPRLYFLSNEELVDILGQGPGLVEAIVAGEASTSFITNLFEGVDTLHFDVNSAAITKVRSKEGEEVTLTREVQTRRLQADGWLRGLEGAMELTVKDAAFHAFATMGQQDIEQWAASWPGQVTTLSSQLWFTLKVKTVFLGCAEGLALRYTSVPRPDSDLEAEDQDIEHDEEDLEVAGEEPGARDSGGLEPSVAAAAGRGSVSGDTGPGAEEEPERASSAGGPADAEEAENQAWEEEVARQIARDEVHAPARAQLEKVLRLKRRFRVNKAAPAWAQMQRVQAEIGDTILRYTAMVRKRLASHVRLSAVSLLTGHVHFRDVLNYLLREGVQKGDEFAWQMQLKYQLQGTEAVVAKSALAPEGQPQRLETQKLDVECEVFGHVRGYGFEYLGNCPRLVVTPLTERCQRSLLVALQYRFGGAPEGPFGTGKTETTKDLGRQLAKLCYVMNCSASYEYAGICRFFKGLASSGAWVCFDDFNRMEARVLSLVSQVIIQVQGGIRAQAGHLQLDDAQVPLEPDCAIFVTLNPGYAGRTELPANLKALFRSVSMVVPDSLLITEILLYSAGFVGARQLAKKIVSVQNLADLVMQKTEIAHDFGLRSIKAIIGIAGALKLQAQNITDSELTEVIDDATLALAPYKAEQVLREVIVATEADVALATEAGQRGEPAASTSRSRAFAKEAGASVVAGGTPWPAGEGLPAQLAATPAATSGLPAGGAPSELDQRAPLSQLGDMTLRTGGSARDHAESMRESAAAEPWEDQLGPAGKQVGELYGRLWQQTPFADRQLRTVYRQIGIDPDQTYDEVLLEEYIILKAVRDFNHSKFAAEEHLLIEGAIKDVFQGAVPDLDKPVQDYGNLQEALLDSFTSHKLDLSLTLQTKALQFYEIQRSKHGCIVAGEPQSGKSTLVSVVQGAVNKAAMNEMVLAVSERRRLRLRELAAEYSDQLVDAALRQTQASARSGAGGEMMAGSLRKKNKKQDKDAQAKKFLQQWREMYRQTALTEEELIEVRKGLTLKGVAMRRLNPKGMTVDELFGAVDKGSQEWHEGLFTQYFREFATQREEKKSWILLDGPLDFTWVENLNSVLDDNKKMSLPNGESIKMSEGMCVLLETDHLRNVTPATVSRCGLVYLHRIETCNPKAIFNQWLRRLPGNLAEYTEDLECATNYLMVEAVRVFEEEAAAGTLGYPGADLHWVMQNFVRLLDSLLHDYYVDFERSGGGVPPAVDPEDLEASLHNVSLGNGWLPQVPDPDQTVYTPSEPPRSAQGQSRQSARPSEQGVATPDARDRQLQKRKRLPRTNFVDSQMRLESALKYTAAWLEAFMIYALVWTFQPVLSESGRKRLDLRLQEKYAAARSDFSSYQKEKKRKLAERAKLADKAKAEGQAGKPRGEKRAGGRPAGLTIQQQASPGEGAPGTPSQDATTPVRSAHARGDGLTPSWTDDLAEKPFLISEFPAEGSFYDYWFSVDSTQWCPFSLELAKSEAQIDYGNLPESRKRLQNFFVPSAASVRHDFMLECLISCQVSTVVVGPACSGRSSLLRSLLFGRVYDYTKHLIADHFTMSPQCDATMLKEHLEGLLECRPASPDEEPKLRPHHENKLICYVEDLHLGFTDQHGDQPAIEAIRDYLTDRAWLSSRKRRWRAIEGVAFFACMASDAPESAKVSRRALHRFALVTQSTPTTESMRGRLTVLSELLVASWPSSLQLHASSVAGALAEICTRVPAHLKPTPMKAHYTFSWREADKILAAMGMIETNALSRQVDVMKLFFHECFRNFGDRILMVHDREWFTQALEDVCRKHFYVVETLESQAWIKDAQAAGQAVDRRRKEQFLWPIADPEQLFYSRWNSEVEGFYMEVEDAANAAKVIEANLERYNDSNERPRLDLILFDRLHREMHKVLRVLGVPGGHLVLVTMKGYGMTSVLKLCAHAAGQQLREIDVSEGLTTEDWHAELRKILLATGEEGKPVTLLLDQYKMQDEAMYGDLALVLKNQILGAVLGQQEVLGALAGIYQQFETQRKASNAGAGDIYADDDLSPEERGEKDRLQADAQAEFRADNERMLRRWPHVRANLYSALLGRVRDNFHLVLQYSPTGPGFREKISKHRELLRLAQVIFMTDLRTSELAALGQGFFRWEHEKAVTKAQALGTGAPKVRKYTVSYDTDAKARVLESIGRMYLQAQEVTTSYAEEEGQVLYMSPSLYLRTFVCYRKLLKERQAVVKEISTRYEAGLDQIKLAQDAIYRYHRELAERSPILQARYDAAGGVLEQIEEEFARVTAQREQLRRDEQEAAQQAEEARNIKEECEDTLNKIVPSLNEAMNAVDAPTKKELAELRALKKPPAVVRLVLQAVCMLLGVPPAPEKEPRTGKTVLSWWAAALGKEVLGNPRLPEVLVDFDRSKLTPETMMAVEAVLSEGGYSYEAAHAACSAATGIFKWVKATREYFYIFKEIEPRRDAFLQAEKQCEEKLRQHEEKKEQISLLDSALEGLKEQQRAKGDVLGGLRAEIQECTVRKKRADLLLKGLAAEKQKWIVCTRMLAAKYTTVTGDVLLSAGYITLLGGFSQRYRARLLQKWTKALTDAGFQCSKEFVFTELFGDSYQIGKWHADGLPQDQMSINNALVAEKTKQFCLLIDPQMQGTEWLKRAHTAAGTLTATTEAAPAYKKSVELAIEMGRTVVIEQAGATVGAGLQSLLKKHVTKYGAQPMIQFCRKSYKLDVAFRLYVATSHPQPHFDANVTNHVTLLNFSVNLECLQAQMLGLVVLNERRDLDETFAENSREAFESIKSLKDVEKTILSLLAKGVDGLLGDEALVQTLSASKDTAEYVAARLRNIATISAFIEKSREAYAPVAFRAAVLYFALQDLAKVNPMYQFSLRWFKDVLQKAMQITNMLRGAEPDPSGGEAAQEKPVEEDPPKEKERSTRVSTAGVTVEDRIFLLTTTLTQEIFKRVRMAVFEADRSLVTYMFTIRVMQAENFLDPGLAHFLLRGTQRLQADLRVPQEITGLPWLSNLIWADLCTLAKLRPFNSNNLLGHIERHEHAWDKFHGRRRGALTFQDLPNKDLIDFSFFSMLGEEALQDGGAARPSTGVAVAPEGRGQPADTNSMAARTAGGSDSRAGSRGQLKRTESQILNDPEIWELSGSDLGYQGDSKSDDEGQVGAAEEPDADGEGAGAAELARYLVERAPSLTGGHAHASSNIDSLWRRTAVERTLILRREEAIKGLCELCVLRCVRPDHLHEGLDRFVRNVLDPDYLDFQTDILPKWEAERQLGAQREQTEREAERPAHLDTETQADKSKVGESVRTPAGQASSQKLSSAADPAATAAKRAAEFSEGAKREREARQLRGGLNNSVTLLSHAYADSSESAPILFIVGQAVNVLEVVSDFHQRRLSSFGGVKIRHQSLGDGLAEVLDARLGQAAQLGDWVILENLHLVPDWLPTFEALMASWAGPETHPRFRVWASAEPGPGFPVGILEKCVKLALQPPGTVKQKMEKLLLSQEKEGFFRKSGPNANFHKNVFLGLAYFHAILGGRQRYGALGWQRPYHFDTSDFEISLLQLREALKGAGKELTGPLRTLRYFFAEINYAGRVHRAEDEATLRAIFDDLINEELAFVTECAEDRAKSHHGLPPLGDNASYFNFLDRALPERDAYDLFGYTWEVESHHQRGAISVTLDRLYALHAKWDTLSSPDEGDIKKSIEMISIKASLSSGATAGRQSLQAIVEDPTGLVSAFGQMQVLLASSSLGKGVDKPARRYNQLIDQPELALLDMTDRKVAELAKDLQGRLDKQFDIDAIAKRFPLKYLAPLNNTINRELQMVKRLLDTIKDSVQGLIDLLDGTHQKPLEAESVWQVVQENRVPAAWRQVSFPTARVSLADFLLELCLKLDFWRDLVSKEISDIHTFWLPAFFEPTALLSTLAQARARAEGVPLMELRNELEVLDRPYEEMEIVKEPHVYYLTGMQLEGASWDMKYKQLEEIAPNRRFSPFPGLRVKTVRIPESELDPVPREFGRTTRNSSAFGFGKSTVSAKHGLSRKGSTNAAGRQGPEFLCPLYQTTQRLTTLELSRDSGPVASVKLSTQVSPSKWVKRAVALILETD